MNLDNGSELLRQIRDYDSCFAEFLKPAGNGQKIMQAILLREAFHRFAEDEIAIRRNAPTAVLDVSCGPGDYSVAWTSQIAGFLPRGMIFYCTDYPGGVVTETGETYTTTTARKIAAAAKSGQLTLARPPVAVDADLFAGADPLMPPRETADIIHWSHSGYHVRDALGGRKDDQRAIASGIDIAIDKMWAALNQDGLMFSVHQTRDLSDGVPSQMLPVSHPYCGALDGVPQRIEARVGQLGGYAVTVNFASPLKFPGMSEARWEALKQPEGWDRLDAAQARTIKIAQFYRLRFFQPRESSARNPRRKTQARGLCRRIQIHCGAERWTYHCEVRLSNVQQVASCCRETRRYRATTARQHDRLPRRDDSGHDRLTRRDWRQASHSRGNAAGAFDDQIPIVDIAV